MKKIFALLLVAAMLCTCAFAAEIAPEAHTTDFTNCTLPANINLSDITATDITLTFYEEDIYDIVAVDSMQAGDTVTAAGQTITVETVEDTDDGKVVNGGEENGGVTFMSGEDTNGWFVRDFEYAYASEIGTQTLPLADQVVVSTYEMDDDTNPTGNTNESTVAAADVASTLSAFAEKLSADSFTQYQTMVTVEDGKVTEIDINYAP